MVFELNVASLFQAGFVHGTAGPWWCDGEMPGNPRLRLRRGARSNRGVPEPDSNPMISDFPDFPGSSVEL